MDDRRRALCVVGMHRSGTSLTSELLCTAGAAAPVHVSGPSYGDEFNQRGYWESLALMELNNAFLSEIGMAWDSPLPMPENMALGSAGERYRLQLHRLLQEEYGNSTLFCIKDPRFSRLLPLLTTVLRDDSVEPVFIIAIRNPLEVAESLNRRDGFHYAKSLLLWMRHMLEVERDSRGERRLFVGYEQVLSDWRSVLARVSEAGEFSWQLNDMATSALETTITASLRHYTIGRDELKNRTDISTWVYELYAACIDATNGAEVVDVFDRIRACVRNADELLAPVMISGYELQLLNAAN